MPKVEVAIHEHQPEPAQPPQRQHAPEEDAAVPTQHQRALPAADDRPDPLRVGSDRGSMGRRPPRRIARSRLRLTPVCAGDPRTVQREHRTARATAATYPLRARHAPLRPAPRPAATPGGPADGTPPRASSPSHAGRVGRGPRRPPSPAPTARRLRRGPRLVAAPRPTDRPQEAPARAAWTPSDIAVRPGSYRFSPPPRTAPRRPTSGAYR